MVSLDNAIIARIEINGEPFEIYVDPEKAYAYLEGTKKDTLNLLVVEEVFKDAKKGERQNTSALMKAFGTTDIYKITETIMKKGTVQLTTEQRKRKLEETRKKIITILTKEAIDPRTKAPHTQIRIENALEEAKVRVDPFKDPREQINEIVKALRPIIPLSFEKIKIAVKVPASYAQRCYGTLKSYGIIKEEWTASGDLIVIVELIAGMQTEFYDKLNKLTGGTVETKILEK